MIDAVHTVCLPPRHFFDWNTVFASPKCCCGAAGVHLHNMSTSSGTDVPNKLPSHEVYTAVHISCSRYAICDSQRTHCSVVPMVVSKAEHQCCGTSAAARNSKLVWLVVGEICCTLPFNSVDMPSPVKTPISFGSMRHEQRKAESARPATYRSCSTFRGWKYAAVVRCSCKERRSFSHAWAEFLGLRSKCALTLQLRT